MPDAVYTADRQIWRDGHLSDRHAPDSGGDGDGADL